jgi:hypothetical protein
VAGDMFCVNLRDIHAFSKVRNRKTGDWFAAKKLQFVEEKSMV